VTAHFNFEERCMAHHQCESQAQNKAAHAAFLAVFEEFREQYLIEGPEPKLLTDLHKMMSDWIKHHILTVDIKLRACIKPTASCST
jgi:hemerythrin-like metal-binding protein